MPEQELGKAKFKLELSMDKFVRNLKDAQGKIRVSSSGMTKSLEKVRMTIARIRNASLLFKFTMAATFYAITRVVSSTTKAFIEQEAAQRQIEARVRSTGFAAGMTSRELREMAAGFQKVTTYGDEAVLSLQGILLTFTNIGHDVLPGAVEAALNMSTVLGQDLKSSALMLGKALNDPILGITALSRAGVQFTQQQKELIKNLVMTGRTLDAQKMILREFEKEMGGAARAARDTFGGRTQALMNEYGDVLEKIGHLFLWIGAPAVETLTGVFELFNNILGESETRVQKLNDIMEEYFILIKSYQDPLNKFTVNLNGEEVLDFSAAIGESSKSVADLQKELNDILNKGAGTFGQLAVVASDMTSSVGEFDAVLRPVKQNIDDIAKTIDKIPPRPILPVDILELDIDTTALSQWYQIWERNLTNAERLALGIAHLNEVMAKSGGLMTDEIYQRELARLKDIYGETADSIDEIIDSTDEMADTMEEATDKMNEYAEQAARNIQDAFADFLFDPFDKGLKGMLDSFLYTLRRMAAEALSAKILSSIFGVGGISGALGSVLPFSAPGVSSGTSLAGRSGGGDVTVMIDSVQISSYLRTVEQFNNRRAY